MSDRLKGILIAVDVVLASAIIGVYSNFYFTKPPAVVPQEIKEPDVEFCDIVEKTIKGVVFVGNKTMGWSGSGVAITPDIILTARHVVEQGKEFEILLSSGEVITSTEVVSSKKHDIGFIKLPIPCLVPPKFGSMDNCRLGQTVYCVGSPYGKENFNSISVGVISALGRSYGQKDGYGIDYGWGIAFTTDAAGHPGNSGGPVFTAEGVLRGIVVGGYSPSLVICVPVDLVIPDLNVISLMFLENKYGFEK